MIISLYFTAMSIIVDSGRKAVWPSLVFQDFERVVDVDRRLVLPGPIELGERACQQPVREFFRS
ncbi:hypothetical protein ASG11_14555 [Sphingomonas sp. Leaf357]|nr:hypothetical protein ASG11_14555 [Sphingomonas sp. Leaf357]